MRRAPDYLAAGTLIDYDPNSLNAAHRCAPDDCVIVTVEGTAPFQTAGATTQFARDRRAVRYAEVMLSRQDPSVCKENRAGQAGGGPTGSGYNPCETVLSDGVPGAFGEPDTGAQ